VFAIMLVECVSHDPKVGIYLWTRVCDLSPGTHRGPFTDGSFTILGYRSEGEAKYLESVLDDKPELWREIVGGRSLRQLTAEDGTKILAAAEEQALRDIVAQETNEFDGDNWHDGISWIPQDQISPSLRERAYQAVYTALLARGRELGYANPRIGHQGNGRHFVYNEESPATREEIPNWPTFPILFIYHPNMWKDSSLTLGKDNWVLIEVDAGEDETYYVGIQGLFGEQTTQIFPSGVTTKQVLLTQILDLEVIIFASRQPDKIDPLPCRLVDVVPSGTGFDPEKVTQI
jgi:hypothetical protein